MWLVEKWLDKGQGPVPKPFLAVSGVWTLSDASRRKILKNFKQEGATAGFVKLWKDHPGHKVEDGDTGAGAI